MYDAVDESVKKQGCHKDEQNQLVGAPWSLMCPKLLVRLPWGLFLLRPPLHNDS